jgi:ectoine hydroxylase-related dioxygenase (phytanoyl-CoA dioxygenase family)
MQQNDAFPGVTERDLAHYREQGYLVVENLFDRASVDAFLAEGTRIVRGEFGPLDGLRPSSPEQSDDEVLSAYITCAIAHKISPLFGHTIADARIAPIVAQLIGPNVKGIHSQFFIKHAGMPGNAWHQDEAFVPTRDRSLCTLWIALDAATVANGCLRFIPGSHRAGVIYPRRRHNDPTLDREEESYGFPAAPGSEVAIELAPGSAVFFNGYLVHGSYQNVRPSGFRRALLYSYTSAETLMAWNPRNDPVSSYEDYRDYTMVCGDDPYAWKGRRDIGRAYLRSPGPTLQDKLLAAIQEAEITPAHS